MKNKIAFFVLLLVLLCTCTNENNERDEDEVKTPVEVEEPEFKFSELALSETIPSDSYSVVSVKKFKFDNGNLSSYIAEQKINGGQLFSNTITASVSYSDGTVTISDDNGNIWTYQLDDGGYAVECHLKEGGGTERWYSFSYVVDDDGKYYLKDVSESIDGSYVYSSLSLDYSDDGKVSVEQSVDGEQDTYIIGFDNVKKVKNVSGLPDLFLSELYPLSMHIAALYGGFLGDTYDYFCTDTYPDSSTELNEHTSYDYTTDDNGCLTGCEVVTVSGGKEYIRNISVKYTI